MGAKITGVDKLVAQIESMPDLVRAEMAKAIFDASEDLVAFMKRQVPVIDGFLERSIRWAWADDFDRGGTGLREGRASTLALKGSYELASVILAGDDKAYYAPWVEFGVRGGRPANPFFFTSYRAKKKSILSRLSAACRRGIKASAAGSSAPPGAAAA
jgi:hypothetical protein